MKGKVCYRLVLLTLILAAAPVGVRAERKAPAAQDPQAQSREVTVGIYVNQINEISLKDNYLVVDFYVWFRWRGDDLKPYDTYAVVDGRTESKGEVVAKKLPDGQNYAYLRTTVRLTKYWIIKKFPLDDHTVDITIEEEEQEGNLIRYVADVENSGTSPRVQMPGWHLGQISVTAGQGVYRSNFGDLSLPKGNETKYGNITLRLDFQRGGWAYFAKIFIAVWIAAGISFLCFFIKPQNVDPRFGLSVGSLFAAVASEYIVVNSLPDTNAITLADWIHILSFAAIFTVVAQSVISLWAAENQREALSIKLDRSFRTILPAVYVVLNVLLIWFR
jgi:hypothetical protein